MKNKATFLNVIASFLLQVVTTISGLIVPRIILANFGSGVYGLIASLTQFLSYITLAEGGVTGVVMAGLYKPLAEGDYNKVSSILVTARKFYRRIGTIYIGYTVLVAILYPILKKTEFSFLYVSGLTIVVSVILLIQFMFSLTLQTLLSADKKAYVVSFTQIAISICNVLLVLLVAHVYPQIHLLKIMSGGLYLFQPLIFGYYIRKHYPIDWEAAEDTSLIRNRWDGFAINLAAFIHDCTDIAVLTVMMDLPTVSVYNVHFMVVGALKSVIVSVLGGLNPTLGHAYARNDKDELNTRIDLYEYIDLVLVFFLYTVCALMLNPFVKLYTEGVHDADYDQLLFGVLLVAAEALYLLKYPHLNLAYAAGRFKEISFHAYMEAGLNIVISVILVHRLGLVGVAIGTCSAMLYRLIFHVYYTTKLVEERKQHIFYGKIFLFSAVTAIGVLLCLKLFPLVNLSVLEWILHAIVYSLILGALYALISVIFFRNEMKFFYTYLRRRD